MDHKISGGFRHWLPKTLAAGLAVVLPVFGSGFWGPHAADASHPLVLDQNQKLPAAPAKSGPPSLVRSSSLPDFRHVFIIMLENHSYADTWYEHDMPYLHQLARTYGLPTQMYGITNPTVPNRVGILSGRGRTIGDNVKEGQLSYPNLIDQLQQHHFTWGAYYQHTETSTDQHPVYNFNQSTLLRFRDIADNSSRRAHLQTFPELKTALANNTVPNFVWVAPNFLTNSHGTGRPGPYQYTYQGAGLGGATAHDTRLENLANGFLQRWIPRIIHSAAWKSGPSAIFITEDETSYDASMPQNDNWASNLGTAGSPSVSKGTILGGNAHFPFPGGINGGGRIPAVVITNVAGHVVSAEPFNQFSILKTIEEAWHLGYLGQAANPQVHTMQVFFHGGSPPAPAGSTPWATGSGPIPTNRDGVGTTPAMPALPPQAVNTPDATLLPSSDPHLSVGAQGQAATSLALFLTNPKDSAAVTGNLTLTLQGPTGVSFARRSSPVGTTRVSNADEAATQFGPSKVSSQSVIVPVAATGTVSETLFITGLMLNVTPNAPGGPVRARLSSGSVQLGTVVLGTIGKPTVRQAPNLLAPVIRPGTVQIRFMPPNCSASDCSSSRPRYEIEIAGQNPLTAIGPNLNEHYTAYTRSNSVLISNTAAELTPLAGKTYWVRVRMVPGPGHKTAVPGAWSLPLPFTALPGPLPAGVS